MRTILLRHYFLLKDFQWHSDYIYQNKLLENEWKHLPIPPHYKRLLFSSQNRAFTHWLLNRAFTHWFSLRWPRDSRNRWNSSFFLKEVVHRSGHCIWRSPCANFWASRADIAEKTPFKTPNYSIYNFKTFFR